MHTLCSKEVHGVPWRGMRGCFVQGGVQCATCNVQCGVACEMCIVCNVVFNVQCGVARAAALNLRAGDSQRV